MKNHGAFVQDRRRDPFARVEIELIKRYGRLIGPNGLAVYTVLAAHANKHTHEVFVHHHTIAATLGIGPKTVQRAIAVLVQYKLLHREVRKGQGKENFYILRDVPKRESSEGAPLFEGDGRFNRTQVSRQTNPEQNTRAASTSCGETPALQDTGVLLTDGLTGQKNIACLDKNESLTGQKSSPYKEQLDKSNQIEPKPTTTTGIDCSQISAALLEYAPAVDDVALRKLVGACQERAPDVRSEEIVHFVREKGALIERMGWEPVGEFAEAPRVRNPLGFLLYSVPMCFEGTSFAGWRAMRAAAANKAAEKERADAERAAFLAPKVRCAHCGVITFANLRCCVECRQTLDGSEGAVAN